MSEKQTNQPENKQKKWHQRTSVNLTILAVIIAIGMGFVHVITGTPHGFPEIVFKENFGYSETFVNIKKIVGMPYIFAKRDYPISIYILQKRKYIESEIDFEKRATREIRKEIANQARLIFAGNDPND